MNANELTMQQQLDNACALLNEVMVGHRDKQSPDYNACDTDPCMWCSMAQKLIDEDKKRYENTNTMNTIPLNELKIEVVHPDDRGGQHAGVVPVRVRVTHVPTGLTAICGSERSQLKNKDIAIAMLEAGIALIKDKQ